MTEKQISFWIKSNLAPIIQKVLSERKNTIYTEDWIGAMAHREVGFLINRYATQKKLFAEICELMKGDYSQRNGETALQYHGFGFWQIDIKSFPEFIKSSDWKNPYLTCVKAISVLEGKRKYLETKSEFLSLSEEEQHRAITAAYNTGEGNVFRSLVAKRDVDFTTANKDYSKGVWQFRELYRSIK